MDAFGSAGEWWIPENPEEREVGLLDFSDSDGFRLTIPVGALGSSGPVTTIPSDTTSTRIVHGRLRDGRFVTLVDCLTAGATQRFPGAPSQDLRSSLGFIGRGVVPDPEPSIDRISVSYAHLRDWVVTHPASARFPHPAIRPGDTHEYRYQQPEADTPLGASDKWSLKLRHTANLSSVSVEGFRARHDCLFLIELEEPIAFSEASVTLLGPLSAFLSFCLDHAVNATALSMRVAGGDKTWVEVGRAQVESTTKDEVIMPPFMLLPLPTLSARAAEVLESWMGFSGDQRRAVSLLAGLARRQIGPVDLRFLAGSQALEAISRVGVQERELDDKEFERRLQVLRESIDDVKVKRWAGRKLEHANWRDAEDLLRHLVAQIGSYVDILAPDRQRFLEDIRSNRNFYTHRDDRRAGRVLEGEELYVLTEGVIQLLKAATLRRLGFSQGEVVTFMNDCQGTLQWRFRVAGQYPKGSGTSA